MNPWIMNRRIARIRMLRYARWKENLIEELKYRQINTLKRRLGRSYRVVFTPRFKKAR